MEKVSVKRKLSVTKALFPNGSRGGSFKRIYLDQERLLCLYRALFCNQSATYPKMRDDLSYRCALLLGRNSSVEHVKF